REPRPGEHEGVDYHFCNYPDMLRGIAARAYINVAAGLETHLYALNPARFKPGKVNLMPIWAKDVPYFRRLPFRRFSVIGVVPTDFEVWQERFSQRAFQPEEADRRMVEASQSFVFMLEDPDVKLVLNTTIAGASDDFITLACGRALPPRLQADQSRARQTLATLLQQLSRKKQLG
ncbi:MAG TPA: hypothetical protein VKQ34_03770, partial [Candidatus Saccharimonadales bacterium]|nr:hypothetical protein [Candidatus Saccharimonadales bacterium]